MPIAPYRRVLAVPAARHTLLLGVLLRIPLFASGVLVTFHVVQTLGRSYTAAGLVATVAMVSVAVSGPWRGRLLDRLGLRRVVLPSVVVTAVCWCVAPFSDYALLLVLVGVAGLFAVPSFAIIRTAVIAAVPPADRRSALSLDSVAVELAFMVGPLLGIWAGTRWPTSWVLFSIEMCAALAGLGLWWANPALVAPSVHGIVGQGVPGGGVPGVGGVGVRARLPRGEWFTAPFVTICAAAACVTVVLTGSDIAILAALREFGEAEQIGLVLSAWGLGSIVGGLVYGALSRSIPAFVLLGGLSLVTMPLALASSGWTLGILAFVAGLLCAPAITATVDQLSQVVPERARAEAMGWHGSAMTMGSALGAPLAGAAIDRSGFGAGFGLVGLLGVVVAAVGWLGGRRRDRARVEVVPAAAGLGPTA